MRARWLLLASFAFGLLNTGCYCHHPCWGFRLHHWAMPACYYPPRKPILFHKHYKYDVPAAMCLNCPPSEAPVLTGVPVAYPMGTVTYPTVIGQPVPLPQEGGMPQRSELPHPMPMNKGQ